MAFYVDAEGILMGNWSPAGPGGEPAALVRRALRLIWTTRSDKVCRLEQAGRCQIRRLIRFPTPHPPPLNPHPPLRARLHRGIARFRPSPGDVETNASEDAEETEARDGSKRVVLPKFGLAQEGLSILIEERLILVARATFVAFLKQCLNERVDICSVIIGNLHISSAMSFKSFNLVPSACPGCEVELVPSKRFATREFQHLQLLHELWPNAIPARPLNGKDVHCERKNRGVVVAMFLNIVHSLYRSGTFGARELQGNSSESTGCMGAHTNDDGLGTCWFPLLPSSPIPVGPEIMWDTAAWLRRRRRAHNAHTLLGILSTSPASSPTRTSLYDYLPRLTARVQSPLRRRCGGSIQVVYYTGGQ
ncbi:hypothetical protein DFP72DRAFT_1054017 [Ephemerocybe angulata]|uniref:Uncharacterized protein n=1 Tax=Ephemerocybe angulata TaxID=980116 RepID=A0A8H6HA73_9AGAR|nr:hypothetical protein DFP72DRAFT_1054017 [Tulosesus angulatus]